jgi:23S rRNA pseudouridine2605 synthase
VKIVLNSYVAKAGLCSRRKATCVINEGLVSVDGIVIKNSAFRVEKKSVVRYKNKILILQEKLYFLLNKPKGFVTTCSDPQGRRTIMDFLSPSVRKGLFPVGRLDINTTGLLLVTNNGDFAQKLSHPSYKMKKTYFVRLHKPVAEKDLQRVGQGLYIDKRMVKVDHVSCSGRDMSKAVVSLHHGEKHIIKRIFLYLGYHVVELDRIQYGPFKKKGIPLGGVVRVRQSLVSKLLQ